MKAKKKTTDQILYIQNNRNKKGEKHVIDLLVVILLVMLLKEFKGILNKSVIVNVQFLCLSHS